MSDDDMALSPEAQKSIADLRVQSIMFDMEVDWELFTLVPKRKSIVPFWLKKWKEKELSSDRQPEDYEGGKDGRF